MTKRLFLLQNQDKLFLNKHHEWVDGRDTKALFKTTLHDVALNQLVEVNTHDFQQRIHILDCEVAGHNTPIISPEDMPPPLARKPNGENSSTLETEASMEDEGPLCEDISGHENNGGGNPQPESLVQEV